MQATAAVAFAVVILRAPAASVSNRTGARTHGVHQVPMGGIARSAGVKLVKMKPALACWRGPKGS